MIEVIKISRKVLETAYPLDSKIQVEIFNSKKNVRWKKFASPLLPRTPPPEMSVHRETGCLYAQQYRVFIQRGVSQEYSRMQARDAFTMPPVVLTCPAIQKNGFALEVSPHRDDCDLIFRPRLQTWKQVVNARLCRGSGPWSPSTALLGIQKGKGRGCGSPLKTTFYLRQLKSCRTSGT